MRLTARDRLGRKQRRKLWGPTRYGFFGFSFVFLLIFFIVFLVSVLLSSLDFYMKGS